MYKQISLFAQKEMINKNGKSTVTIINQTLTPILYSVSLNDISTGWLVTLDEKDLIPSGARAILCRFIGYLIEKNIISDGGLTRLVECSSSFYKHSTRGQIATLLTTPIYNEFKSKYGVKDNKTIAILSYPKVRITDERVCKVLNSFMNHLKVSDAYTIATKKLKLSQFNQIVQKLFRKYNTSQLSKSRILNYIKEESIEKDVQGLLIEILISLNKESILQDPLLKHFISEVTKVHDFKKGESQNMLSVFVDLLPEFTKKSRLFTRHKRGKNDWIVLNNSNVEISMLLGEFFSQVTYSTSIFYDFFSQYEKSLEGYKLRSLDDLTYRVFHGQIAFFKENFKSQKYIKHLVGFYLFLLQKNIPIFEDVKETRFLNRHTLTGELYRGFDIVFYQPLECVPKSDRWILSYNESQCTNEGITASMTYRIDFTEIGNIKLRDALKHYIWYQDSSINNKNSNKKYIIKFLEFTEKYTSDKITHFSKTTEFKMKVTLGMVLAYKNQVLRKYTNNRTILNHIYATRDFLKHVRDNELIEIDKGYEYYLTYTRDTTYSNSQPIKDEHFPAIFNLLKEKSEESITNKLCMLIFYLLAVTELRPTNILSLRRNCVKEIKPDKYVIETQTKTSNKEIIQVPISLEVKKQIDEIKRITKKHRQDNKNEETNKYLFIVKGQALNNYGVMHISTFNKYLGEICNELKIPKYTTSNIRDTHMTKAEEFIIQSNYSEMQQNVLSGHKSSKVDEQYYVKTEKRTILKAVQGVRIGDEIAENHPTRAGDQTGIDDVRFNELLTSEHFITTTEFLEYYNNQLSEVGKEIVNIDSEIASSSSIDRMSALVNYRDLLEGYRNRILDIKHEK